MFGLPIHYDLNVMKSDQDIYSITASVLMGMRDALRTGRPDLLLVHGDTTTTFAASLAAYYEKILVGHVEAGLRSFDKLRPYPEEMNRRLADQLTDYFYAPTATSRENLLREGFDDARIVVTGNTVVDALLEVAARDHTFADPLLEGAGRERRLVVVTAHRRESFGDAFNDMCLAMRDLVEANPDVVHLMKKAYLILTDSGGIQEEAPALGKPVVVMREVTERTEGVEAGTAILAGTSRSTIRGAVQRLLDNQDDYRRMARAINPYGDGHAAERIAEHVVSALAGHKSRSAVAAGS
jgi:UDP-N-acetylglucosamine 2-epimerase (non-hydrolysing)